MRKRWLRICGVIGVLVAAPAVMAADHLDGAEVKKDPASDITDLYSWVSADGAKTYLVMNVSPVARVAATDAAPASKFSDAVQYVFHTSSMAKYGEPATPLNVVCTFDAAQVISCWAGSEYVHGDASVLNADAGSAGITSANGKLKVFAGPRDDPFFFNLDGFKDVAARATDTIKNNAALLQLNPQGCPENAALMGALAGKLSKDPHADGGPAKNFFKGLNVLSIVIAVDTSVVTSGGPIMSVWASTNKAN